MCIRDSRADQAAHRLRDLLPRRATVVRDGNPVEVEAAEIVVGDLVILAAGDRIPADLRIGEAHELLIDVSTLTGESVPEALTEGDRAYSGTFIVEGEGRAVVV